MRMGATEREERAVLKGHLPGLFTRRGRMLYVGANQLRPPHHAQVFCNVGWEVHLLEVYAGNVAKYATGPEPFATVTLGDVRFDPKTQEGWDVTFWWHGLEHVPAVDVPETLALLEQGAGMVVLGCPDGVSPQGPEYGNEAERHLWSVTAADLTALGYEVAAYAPAGRRHLLAWKGSL